jgi:hypothetical protein
MAKLLRTRLVDLLALAATIGAVPSTGFAGPTVLVGANVPDERRVPAEQIEHSQWDSLLKKYVDDGGMVNYAAWKANPDDMQALDSYLSHLSAASFSRQASAGVRLAFWINAYNAVTVKGILREYPTTSIRNHTAKLFGYNIWDDLKMKVGGRPYSLNEIEHEILRKLGEPRIHFAIVCASIGCPRLLNEAYVPDRLDEQLTANTRAFFADPGKFRYDAQQRSMTVSPILDWFGEDFGSTKAEQMRRIAPYLPDPAARRIAESGDATIRFLDYDWSLNDQARSAQAKPR